MDGGMDGWMCVWVDGLMDGWMCVWVDGLMDGWMEGGREGGRDGWMDGWMDGCMCVWMDGWMDWMDGRDEDPRMMAWSRACMHARTYAPDPLHTHRCTCWQRS